MAIYFQVETEGLTEMLQDLGVAKNKAKIILRTALNKTATQTMALLITKANEEYLIITPSAVKKTMTLKKATTKSLAAVITSKGRPNELYNFVVTPRTHDPANRPAAGHKGHVKRSNSGKYVYYTPGRQDQHKAFTVEYASGHVTVAQRIPGSQRATPRADHPEGEEAIKTLYSPSVPKMLGGEDGVFKAIKPEVYVMLKENLEAQIVSYLGKRL